VASVLFPCSGTRGYWDRRWVFLRQNTLGGHFPDVGGGEVNTVAEAVLQLGQFDPLGINGGNYFIQLFLGRDHDPARSDDLVLLEQVLADLAELFDGRAQVFDLVTAASDVLAYFVNDDREPRAPLGTPWTNTVETLAQRGRSAYTGVGIGESKRKSRIRHGLVASTLPSTRHGRLEHSTRPLTISPN
jgi:hypothetical protein